MSDFKDLISEIKKTLGRILLFDIFIESLLVFLSVYLLTMVFNLSIYYAIIPSVIYFVVMLIRKKNLASISSVENKYPILHEALRTASDTMDEDNYLVNELRNQVKDKVKNVKASSFVDFKGDILKIILSIVLIFMILSLSICRGTNDTCRDVLSKTDIKYISQNIKISDVYNRFSKEEIKGTNLNGQSVNQKLDVKNEELLLGNEGMAQLGDNNIKIKFKLADDQIDIRDVSDEIVKKEFMDTEVSDIQAIGDANFEEDISREDKEIVRNYFDKIAKG